jgi:CBS domain-containing protein/SAM-dependent methyltransferase
MRVSDVMSKQVDFVSTNTSVKNVCHLIFGRNINGVPVCKEKKVVGFITERDILSKFYPSMQDYMEDPVHSGNFEAMESKVSEIFSMTAKEIMSKNPTTVTPDTPLLRAQSLMFVHRVGRLPVVDKKDNLVGMISKGDIFRSVVGEELQFVEDEEYHDWLSRHYDLVVKWEKRLGHEIPDLVNLFRKENIKKVLDTGCGTGEHDVALAKEGFDVVGLERSSLMFEASKAKWANLESSIKRKVSFLRGNYAEILRKRRKEFGAAIFMGNALSHNPNNYKSILEAVSNSLLNKGAVLVLQIINFEKVFKTNKRLEDFNIASIKNDPDKEYLFVEFYDPPIKPGDRLTLNMAILYFDGKRWYPKSFNNTPIVHMDMKKVELLLKKLGFLDISFYGGMLLGELFKYPFDPRQSDYLNVVARR